MTNTLNIITLALKNVYSNSKHHNIRLHKLQCRHMSEVEAEVQHIAVGVQLALNVTSHEPTAAFYQYKALRTPKKTSTNFYHEYHYFCHNSV